VINKNLVYAVIGVSQNEEKYGHKVFKDLLNAGYYVIPMNPKGGEIFGKKIWPGIINYHGQIDIAILVVPPAISLQVLKEIRDKDIKEVWFQPGSESAEAIAFCVDNNIKYTANACIMIERQNKNK
jgi:predicted CoA-binding protein